jgi:hypothetical protein
VPGREIACAGRNAATGRNKGAVKPAPTRLIELTEDLETAFPLKFKRDGYLKKVSRGGGDAVA